MKILRFIPSKKVETCERERVSLFFFNFFHPHTVKTASPRTIYEDFAIFCIPHTCLNASQLSPLISEEEKIFQLFRLTTEKRG